MNDDVQPSEPLHPDVKSFMRYLANHPEIRWQVAAQKNRSLFYAGTTTQNNPWNPDGVTYRRIEMMRQENPVLKRKRLLHEVLQDVSAPDSGHAGASREQQLYPWRALSGLYAAQASGAVSVVLGRDVTRENLKIFALTEIPVLQRNKNIDDISRDMLEGIRRQIDGPGRGKVNLAVIRADADGDASRPEAVMAGGVSYASRNYRVVTDPQDSECPLGYPHQHSAVASGRFDHRKLTVE